jgi:hypothetical protein
VPPSTKIKRRGRCVCRACADYGGEGEEREEPPLGLSCGSGKGEGEKRVREREGQVGVGLGEGGEPVREKRVSGHVRERRWSRVSFSYIY